MQTTLLGLGIALILALVAALVGPIFIDWGRYRSGLEAEAARMVGLPVRIGGAIDVRILPTPSISLRDVEVGSRAAPVFGAQGARVELSLTALMRGEWRAAVLTIDAPDFSFALDPQGRIATHAAAPAIDLEHASIDRIVIANGTFSFDDLASRSRVVLDKIAFAGDVRSLAGQLRGEGTFASAGQNYRYRLSTARPTESGMRFRFNLEPAERPLTIEMEGNIQIEQGAPRYEGSVTLVRPAGVVLASGETVANEPWKVVARGKGDARGAQVEQIEVQYGPDERSLRMNGTATLRLGVTPQLDVALGARQIDLDRAMADPTGKRLPLAAMRGLGESLSSIGRMPVPLRLTVNADIVTLSGGTVQGVRGDIRSGDDFWRIESFEFRAPGYTQVALSGRLEGPKSAVEYSGPVSVESADPRALLTWFEGFERARNAIGPLRMRSDITLGKDRVAFERINAAFDGKTFEGRLAYDFPRERQPAKLAAALNAPELDVDGTIAFVSAAFAGSSFVRPGEISLTANIGRTLFADTEARAADINLRLDQAGLRIEKFSIGDLGGTAIAARGAIDIAGTPPKGEITLSANSQRLDGLIALTRHYYPDLAAILRRHATTLSPAKVDGSFRIDPPATPAGAQAVAKLSVNGNLGALRLTVAGEGTGDMSDPDSVDTRFRAQLASADNALLAMLGLDRLVGSDKKAATFTASANGPLGGDLRDDVGIASDGIDAGAVGTVRLLGKDPGGALAVAFSANHLRGNATPTPVALRSSLNFASRPIRLDDLTGQIGEANVRGRLALSLDGDWRVDGKITASQVDIPLLVAVVTGGAGAPPGQTWSSQRFGGIPFTVWRGRIELEAPQAKLTPSLLVSKLHTVIELAPNEIAFNDVSGAVGGGTATAQAIFRSTASGLAVSGKVALGNAEARQILRAGSQAPVSGRLSTQLEFEGAGSNPAALVGALRGTGTITLENAQIASLDPRAIDSALRAADRGSSVTAPRVADMVARSMETGVLNLPWVSAPIEISTGRARLGQLVMPPQAGELSVGASVDLVEETLDARVTLFGRGAGASASAAQRPEVSVAVRGPFAAPQRTVDTSVLVGWLTLQAVDREAKKLEEEEREAERRARLDAIVRERAEQLKAQPVQPDAAGPAAPEPQSGRAGRMPPPPRTERGLPRAGVIETAPLPVLPR